MLLDPLALACFAYWLCFAQYYAMFVLSSTAMKPFKIKASKTYVSYVTAFVVLCNVCMQA